MTSNYFSASTAPVEAVPEAVPETVSEDTVIGDTKNENATLAGRAIR